MVRDKDLAKTIEKAFFISLAIKKCAKEYEDVDDFMSVKCVIDLLVEKLDCAYSKIINEKLL